MILDTLAVLISRIILTDIDSLFYADEKIYVALAVVLIIWLGIIVYLFSIERKIKKLEDKISGKEKK